MMSRVRRWIAQGCALAKCDREEQRWARAYADEVINLAELKGYRSEILARRRGFETQRQEFQDSLERIGHAVAHVEALMDYCARVRGALQTFSLEEKHRAFEAIALHVTWTPKEPLRIQASLVVAPSSTS
jgi:hypothetical protein